MPTASFCERYKILKQIGEGAFSEVLKCRDRKTGECFAAKRLKKPFKSMQEVFDSTELIVLQKVKRHPNILLTKEVHYDDSSNKILFMFELMDMSLYDFLRDRKRCLPESRAKNFLYQMLCGLNHLHKCGLFHRDIKPENILLKDCNTKNEIIKIGDLGSMRGIFSKHPYTEYISTRWYRSPECLLTTGYYGPKMDVWALGCVFYEMLTLKPLFAGNNEIDQLAKIHNILGTPSIRLISKYHLHKSLHCQYFTKQIGTGLSPLLTNITIEGHNVLKMMITYDADVRSNVKRLMDHKYFICFREPIEKPIKARSSSVGPPVINSVGDYKGFSKFNMQKSVSNYPKAKYYNTITHGSLNSILKCVKGNSKKVSEVSTQNILSKYNSRQSRKTEELYFNVEADLGSQKPSGFQRHYKDPKQMREQQSYRKTTSNIPQVVQLVQEQKRKQQSKSYVMSKKRLEPIMEVSGDEMVRPNKVMKLDTCYYKENSKYLANRRREWRC